jgi:hypothetical protein
MVSDLGVAGIGTYNGPLYTMSTPASPCPSLPLLLALIVVPHDLRGFIFSRIGSKMMFPLTESTTTSGGTGKGWTSVPHGSKVLSTTCPTWWAATSNWVGQNT